MAEKAKWLKIGSKSSRTLWQVIARGLDFVKRDQTSGSTNLVSCRFPIPLQSRRDPCSNSYRELRSELHRHDCSTFIDEPPSIAQGGNGVVVTGCPTCRKKFGTMPQFLDHLTDDVLPAVHQGRAGTRKLLVGLNSASFTSG